MAIYSHSIAAAASSARCLTNCVNITHTHTCTYTHVCESCSEMAKLTTSTAAAVWLHMSMCVCMCVCVWCLQKFNSMKNKKRSLTHTYAHSLIESPKKEWIQQTKRDLCVCVFWDSCRQMPSLAAPQMRCYHEFHLNPTYKAQKQLLLLFYRAVTLTHTHTRTQRLIEWE